MAVQIKLLKWKWIGHIAMRKNIPPNKKQAVSWNPPRTRGRQRRSWGKTTKGEAEIV
jgi:hypothetical protein